jgi:hypothetical protein
MERSKIFQQLKNKIGAEDIKLKNKLSFFKPLLLNWLYNVWIHIPKKRIIQIELEQCRLSWAFQTNFQTTALNANIRIPFFKKKTPQLEDTTNKKDYEKM